MSPAKTVLAIGLVDDHGVAGLYDTHGSRHQLHKTWEELDTAPPGNGKTFRQLFGRPDPAFRRLDAVSRSLVLAAEAAGIGRVLPESAREDTAMVFETTVGCLDTDLKFARSLQDGIVNGPQFPYTLPSTCLGEVALRHRLRGPGLCLSVSARENGASLREATRTLDTGEVPFVVAASFDVLGEARAGAAAGISVVVVLIGGVHVESTPVTPWPDCTAQGFAQFAWRVRERTADTSPRSSS